MQPAVFLQDSKYAFGKKPVKPAAALIFISGGYLLNIIDSFECQIIFTSHLFQQASYVCVLVFIEVR